MKKLFFYRIFILSLLFMSLSIPAIAKMMNILVYPFENIGDKQYSWISAGMTETVINDLMDIREVSVISNADRRNIIEEMKLIFSELVAEKTMLKVGKLAGANVIFTGSYLVSENHIRVIARLINVETGREESSACLDGSLKKIFDLQDKVVLTLLSETAKVTIPDVTKVKVTEAERKKIAKKPRPKTTVYELYAKGLERDDTNPKEALDYYKEALYINENYVSALIKAGLTAEKLNLFDEALYYLNSADKTLKSRKTTKTIDYAMLMKNIGAVYYSKGDLDRALRYYVNSQKIRDSLGLQSTVGYANLITNIGVVYWSKRDISRALRYYTDSQSIQERIGLQDTADYATLTMNIGNVYNSIGDLNRALRYYTDSQSIQERIGLQNTSGYAGLLFNIGLLYEKQGERGMAGRYYRKAYNSFVSAGYIGDWKDKALSNAQRLGY